MPKRRQAQRPHSFQQSAAPLAGPAAAKFADVKPGDRLVADGDFACLGDGQVVTVERDKDGLFVVCRRGRHDILGQVNEDGDVGGLCTPAERAAWLQRAASS